MRGIRVAAALAMFIATMTVGIAEPSQAATAGEPSPGASEYLADHPGGILLSDHEVAYADGSGFVDADPSSFSLSQCGANRFCMWTAANYTGSFSYVTGSGTTINLSGTVKSFWNNRSNAARLYNNAGTSSTCYSTGAMRATLAIGYQSPAKVFLSASGSC